jgi:predicted nucleic acid-binding protein
VISLDSYGWIERFTNGPKASAYNAVIDITPPHEIITSTISLFEVYRKIKLAKGEEIALERVASLSTTNLIPVDQTISLEAADHSLEKKLHFADSLIYATARHYKAQLYTSDEHLRGLDGVIYV